MSKKTIAENEAPEVVETPVEEGTTPAVKEAPKKPKKKSTKPKKVEVEVKEVGLSDTELERLKHTDKTAYTKYIIDHQPKIRMMIPTDGLSKGSMTHPFIINGAKWEFAVGEMIDVPVQIAEMIKDRFEIKGNPFEIVDGNIPNIGV